MDGFLIFGRDFRKNLFLAEKFKKKKKIFLFQKLKKIKKYSEILIKKFFFYSVN